MVHIMKIDEMSQYENDLNIMGDLGVVTIMAKTKDDNNRNKYPSALVSFLKREGNNTGEEYKNIPKKLVKGSDIIIVSCSSILDSQNGERFLEVLSNIGEMEGNFVTRKIKKIILLSDYSNEEEKKMCDTLFKAVDISDRHRRYHEFFIDDNDWNALKSRATTVDKLFV